MIVTRPKLLIVDDQPNNLKAFSKLLAEFNVDIMTALSGNKALQLALDYKFSLVLMDVQMPDMDGYETADLLLNIESNEHVSIIFITAAYKDADHQIRGYRCGAVDYLEKPVDDRILLSKVSIFIKLWEQQQALKTSIMMLEEQKKELEREVILRKKANDKTEYLATHDVLTGLANRALLNGQLDTSFASAKRSDKKVAILFIDLDGFKLINDQHSHKAGDFVLTTITQRLLSCVRGMDTVSRYGGDEFLILLPNLDNIEEALCTAERVKNEVVKNIAWQGNTLIVSASIGVAIYPDTVNTSDMLIMGADNAMYEAKSHGKNRVVLFSG